MISVEITHVVDFKRELEEYEEAKQEWKQWNLGELTLDFYLKDLIANAFHHIYGRNGYEANIYKIRFENVNIIGREKIRSVIDEFFGKRNPYNDEDKAELKRVYNWMMSEVEKY